MDKIIVLSIFILISLIGFIELSQDVRSINSRVNFANEYLNMFKKMWENKQIDFEAYNWLIHRSTKLQNEMGELGIVHSFHPPYQNYLYKNYPIILNVIPEIRKELSDSYQDTRQIDEYIALVNESLIRYVGSLDDQRNEVYKEIKNPIIWLRKGFAWILLLPLSTLHWLGIISNSLIKKIPLNPFFKILAGLITLLGGISTVMTIIVGWDSFINAAINLFTP